MKRALCIGILSASVLAGCVYWNANRNVYSQNIYAGGWSYGPSWHIGMPRHWIGFDQHTFVGMASEWGKKRQTPTYTDIDLGSLCVSIKVPAWQVGLVAAFLIGFGADLSWLALARRASLKEIKHESG